MADTIHTTTQGLKNTWAAESTWGVEVTAASKWFGATSFSPGPTIETKEFAPLGVLAETVVAQQSEQVDIDVDGEATYEDLAELLSDVITHQLATDIPSYTVGCGGIRVAGAVINSWRVSGNPSEVKISGAMVGKSFANAAQTVGVAQLAATPVLNDHVEIVIDGITIVEGFDWEISAGGLWALNRFVGQNVPGTVTQRKNDLLFKCSMEKNATNDPLLTETGIVAVTVTCTDAVNGKAIEFAFNAKLRSRDKFSDNDGIYGFGLEYRILNQDPKTIAITHTA